MIFHAWDPCAVFEPVATLDASNVYEALEQLAARVGRTQALTLEIGDANEIAEAQHAVRVRNQRKEYLRVGL